MPRSLPIFLCLAFVVTGWMPARARGQQASGDFQGSVVNEAVRPGVMRLLLDQAVAMGLRYNLGVVLSGDQARAARATRLQLLQPLLPAIHATATEAVQQVNLQAEGLRIPGFPAVIGPFGFTDIRASMDWALLNLSSLKSYLASKHDFESAQLSLEDSKDLVVFAVGNAYMRVIADRALVESAKSRLATATVSLNHANQQHQAGTAPLIDTLRSRVDYQTEQQNLIAAQNTLEKDKIALARAIGLPLDQKFDISDEIPFASLGDLNPEQAVREALANRQDLRALEQRVQAAGDRRSAAKAERYPTVTASGDYGDIGPTLGHSHGTFNAVGQASVPLFEEARIRGDEQSAEARLQDERNRLNSLRGRIAAEVRESILDIQAAAQEVEVAGSTVELAKEALSEAQQRYTAGVSGNLAVSQAQTALAQAEERYVASLYGDNVAKLALARSLGVARSDYKKYLGGK